MFSQKSCIIDLWRGFRYVSSKTFFEITILKIAQVSQKNTITEILSKIERLPHRNFPISFTQFSEQRFRITSMSSCFSEYLLDWKNFFKFSDSLESHTLRFDRGALTQEWKCWIFKNPENLYVTRYLRRHHGSRWGENIDFWGL